jgi:hypothetical protein
MITKNYYTNESTHIQRSYEDWNHYSYSLAIPWNEVYTNGWQEQKPDIWGYERKLITRSDPEYFAPDGIIRSNILPQINPNDPIYSFDRAEYTFDI